MKIVVISSPDPVEKEHEILHELFERGLTTFHLRKPDAQKEELEEYIRGIKPGYISRIMIHSHFDLLKKYNLKGVHLPEKARQEPETATIIKTIKTRRLNVSTSVHELEEIKKCSGFDYIFLSPIYDSISKPGYFGKITPESFRSWRENNPINTKVVALGGIDLDHIDELKEATFDGVGLLGAIWNTTESNQKFSEIKLKAEME